MEIPEYGDTQNKIEDNNNWYTGMIEITDVIQKINEVMEDGTNESKRSILSQAGSNLVWNDEILSIHCNKSIDTLIEGIKRIKSEFPKFEPRFCVAPQGLNEKTDDFSPAFSMMLRTWDDVRMSLIK